MPTVHELIDSQRETYVSELQEYLRIPSVSTLTERNSDTIRAAEWTAAQMRAAGLQNVALYPTARHPVVYGEWLGAPGAPTVLMYGHYDVQPAERELGWDTDPFEPVVRDGNIYARGAADDKGQVYVNIAAIRTLMQAHGGKLPVNVKLLIEGEEEIGSPNLDKFIHDHQELLRADVVVVSDSGVLALDKPSMVYGLRGLLYVEIELQGPFKDLHSGQYGGVVHNPAQAIAELVAKLHNEDGSIAVEGFYDKVRVLTEADRKAIAETGLDEATLRERTGVPQSWGEAGFSLGERIGARPTLEINGIWGGFTGEGAKTVLPAKAAAKISCRLVPNQDPREIEVLLRRQIEKLTPPTMKLTFKVHSYGDPAIVPIDSNAMSAAIKAYEVGWGGKPLFQLEGGSIPVVATFNKTYGLPVLLVGYGLPDDGPHGPNEKFALECLYRGLHTSAALLEELGTRTPESLRG